MASKVHKYSSVSLKRMKSELKRMDLLERYALKKEAEENDKTRPRVYGDCEGFVGPCPWASCKFHLAYDINPSSGSLKENFPGLEFHEMPETCALRVAMRGGITLEETGELLHTSRERIRQICDSTAPMFAEALGLVPGESFNDRLDDLKPAHPFGRKPGSDPGRGLGYDDRD